MTGLAARKARLQLSTLGGLPLLRQDVTGAKHKPGGIPKTFPLKPWVLPKVCEGLDSGCRTKGDTGCWHLWPPVALGWGSTGEMMAL